VIAEALKYLVETATKAAAPQKLDSDPRTMRYALGGEEFEFDLPPAPRGHSVATLDDVIALAKRFESDGSEGTHEPAVWYDERAVVLVIDDNAHRLETATLSLAASDVFARVVRLWECREWHDHRAFIRLLRIDLARTLDPVELLERVRRVRFENGSAMTGEVQRNRESLGHEITRRVETGGEIPEEVTLMVPVYKTPGETDPLPLRCAVEVDPARGAFQLLPLPDEIERVRHLAVARIADRLGDGLPESIPAYFGRP
jgi:hypothetical protein